MGNLNCLGLCRNIWVFFMCALNHSVLQQLNGLTTAVASSWTSQHREAPMSLKRRKDKLVTPCAHGGYKASYDACFMDIRCLQKHYFNSAQFFTVLLKNSRKIMAWHQSPWILIRLLRSYLCMCKVGTSSYNCGNYMWAHDEEASLSLQIEAFPPGHSQILSSSHGEKLGEGLGSLLCDRPEMVDSDHTNEVHITY